MSSDIRRDMLQREDGDPAFRLPFSPSDIIFRIADASSLLASSFLLDESSLIEKAISCHVFSCML